MFGRVYLASMTVISFLKPLFVLIGFISLSIQYVIELVMCSFRFGFFSYGAMAEKTAAIVGCWLSLTSRSSWVGTF